MANPKTFRILGKRLCLSGVLAFLASFLVTFWGMTNAFQQLDGTGDVSEAALEKSISLSLRISMICTPIGLLCLGAGVCCYLLAAVLIWWQHE